MPLLRLLCLLCALCMSCIAPSASAAQAASTGEKIVVGIGIDKPPNSFMRDGVLSGAEHDIFVEAGRRMGLQFDFDVMSNNRLLVSLEKGMVGAASAVPFDVDRPGVYFSDTLVAINNVAIAKADRKLNLEKIEDLKGVPFVIWQGGWHDLGDEFRTLYRPDPATGKFQPEYNELVSQYTQNVMFWNDRVQVIVISYDIFNWYKQDLARGIDTGVPVQVYHLFKPTLIRAAFRTAALRDRFNRALREMHRDGSYKAILNSYAMTE